MSWTLTKKIDFLLRVQARSRGRRWCWTFKRAQAERSRAGRWSWVQKVGLLLLGCSSTATDITCDSVCSAQQLKQQLRSTSTLLAAQWRGPHCLNIISCCQVLAVPSTASSVFPCRVEPLTLSLPPPHPSLISLKFQLWT